MATTGSLRGVTIDGIPHNAAGDADIALGPRFEKTAMPHTGGNIMQYALAPASAEAVKIIVTASEYDTLRSIADGLDDVPLSYQTADGSSFKTVGRVNLGPFQSNENACEVTFLTSTGVWDIFSVE